jgi:hypothetical protein
MEHDGPDPNGSPFLKFCSRRPWSNPVTIPAALLISRAPEPFMHRAFYSGTISDFLSATPSEVVGTLLTNSGGSATEHTQRNAWLEQIRILQDCLLGREGKIYFEYSIPRMGSRIDVVLLLRSALFVLEFKIGASEFTSYALNQVYDYALDLKNFHSASRDILIAPS